MIAAGAPVAAWAEDPVSFGSSPVVDTVGALGGRLDDVERAIGEAADASGRQLFVAYVDEFTNPAAADAWANETAIANNLGAEDYLLAVAVDGRAYYLSADSDASLSDEELNRISLEVIEPELRDEDWAGAAIAGAEAIGGTGGGGGGGISWGFIWFLVIAGAVVIVIAIVLARRKKRKQVPAGTSVGGVPLPSLDELRRTAGSALVQADDAVKTSEEELGFAVASYGDDATADFRTALDGAKAKLAEAFTLQQRLDDAEPDSDEERRAWYGGIIQLAGEADAMLDEQAERFDELRDLERTAPEALARLEAAAA
ncbi:MAG TPA: TPM domain-containing protein, partial [Agromyces sp.]|nr:TPM domain-containing protein [Agromyces sp.]